MKKIFIVLATAGLMVGCAHNEASHQGSTSPDSGVMRGQGAASEDLQRNNAAGQGGTSSQTSTIGGSTSSNSQSITNSSTGNSPNSTGNYPSSSATGVTPGAAK